MGVPATGKVDNPPSSAPPSPQIRRLQRWTLIKLQRYWSCISPLDPCPTVFRRCLVHFGTQAQFYSSASCLGILRNTKHPAGWSVEKERCRLKGNETTSLLCAMALAWSSNPIKGVNSSAVANKGGSGLCGKHALNYYITMGPRQEQSDDSWEK